MAFSMRVQVTGRGDKTVKDILKRYKTKNINKMSEGILDELAHGTEMSMKLRALKWTGALRDSIMVERVTQTSIEISAGGGLPRPYAEPQGFGFQPHYVPIPVLKKWVDDHGGVTFSYGMGGGKKGFFLVRRFQPFFLKAQNSYLTPERVELVCKKHIALMEARR